MATIELEEYGAVALQNGAAVPLAVLPAAGVRQIASGAGGATVLGGATALIAVTSDADCRINVGAPGAAGVTHPLLKAGVLRWFKVRGGASIRFD